MALSEHTKELLNKEAIEDEVEAEISGILLGAGWGHIDEEGAYLEPIYDSDIACFCRAVLAVCHFWGINSIRFLDPETACKLGKREGWVEVITEFISKGLEGENGSNQIRG